MSGTRNHYIPKFLQVGFSSHQQGDEKFVWAFRKGAKPFNTNLINSGVEGHFYISDGDATVDEMITGIEPRFASLVHDLREGGDREVPNSLVSEMLAHLEVRTRHLRESFRRSADYIAQSLLEYLDSEARATAYFARRFERDPGMFRKMFEDSFSRMPLSHQQRKALLRLAMNKVPDMLGTGFLDIRKMVGELRIEYKERVANQSKLGHLKGLRTNPVPIGRRQHYEQYQYNVVTSDIANFVLGDSALFFMVEDAARPFRPFIDKGTEPKGIYLPLSPRRILVGRATQQCPNLTGLAEAAAGCALEWFVSHRNGADQLRFQETIGIYAMPMTTSELDELMDELLNE